MYDLFDWGKGFCYTYDPPQKSRGGAPNGLYFLLGHKYLYEKDYNNYDNKSIGKYYCSNYTTEKIEWNNCIYV